MRVNKLVLLLASLVSILGIISPADAHAASSKTSISGKIKDGEGYRLLLIASDGEVLQTGAIPATGKFSFKNITLKSLKNASLFLAKDGASFGPIVLKKIGTTKSSIFFSGKNPPDKSTIALGTISLQSGYALVKKLPNSAVVNVKTKADAAGGAPIGAGKLGYVAATTPSAASSGGKDSDRDGIVDLFDVDVDGDLLANSFDAEAESDQISVAPRNESESRIDMPFTTLFLEMANTVNVNVGSIDQGAIDTAFAANFTIVYFFGIGTESYSGAHIVCDASLTYCRSTADGGTTSQVSGVSESTSPPSGRWSDFNDDGSGFPNLDLISNFQGGGEGVFSGSVQPQVATSLIQPGDISTIEFMNGSTVAEQRALSIPSYFVTVPALKSYNLGSGETTIDYSSPPGSSPGSPLTLSGSTLTVTFWRPQRQVLADESGSLRDIAALQYGLVISTNTAEFGCASNFYSALNSLNTGGSTQLWPLRDTVTEDAEPNASNTLGFTLDVAGCIAANGAGSGDYRFNLTAAGAQVTGGSNRAVQTFYVRIP